MTSLRVLLSWNEILKIQARLGKAKTRSLKMLGFRYNIICGYFKQLQKASKKIEPFQF